MQNLEETGLKLSSCMRMHITHCERYLCKHSCRLKFDLPIIDALMHGQLPTNKAICSLHVVIPPFFSNMYICFNLQMVGTSTRMPPIQRLVEIKTIAEQLHFKMSTLLLHTGKVSEAIAWFRQHTANYRRLVGAPEVIFLHWEWLSRQYLVFAQLLETSSATALQVPSMGSVPAEKPTEWEFHPAYYYQVIISCILKVKNKLIK